MDLLLGPWKNRFDLIIFVSPTIHLQQEVWEELDGTGIMTTTSLEPELVQRLKEFMIMEENKEKEALLVLDDLSYQTRDKKKADVIDEVAFIGRHLRISVVALVQKLTLLSPSFRSQLDSLYLFHIANIRELAMIHMEMSCTETFGELKKRIWALKKYQLVVLDNCHGRIHYNPV